MSKLFLLDSSALLNNHSFEFAKGKSYFMTNSCFDELKEMKFRLFAESALKNGLLEICDPCPLSVEKTMKFLDEIGDRKLSRADISLIALALEKKSEKPTVVSDDYSIQNACKHLGIDFQPILQGRIKMAKTWKK